MKKAGPRKKRMVTNPPYTVAQTEKVSCLLLAYVQGGAFLVDVQAAIAIKNQGNLDFCPDPVFAQMHELVQQVEHMVHLHAALKLMGTIFANELSLCRKAVTRATDTAIVFPVRFQKALEMAFAYSPAACETGSFLTTYLVADGKDEHNILYFNVLLPGLKEHLVKKTKQLFAAHILVQGQPATAETTGGNHAAVLSELQLRTTMPLLDMGYYQRKLGVMLKNAFKAIALRGGE